MRGIDAVKIIQRERGEKAGPCGRQLVLSRLQAGCRRAKVGVPALRGLLEVLKTHEGRRELRVIDQRKVQIKVGEEQYRQVQPGFIHGELSFAQVTLPIVRLN